VPNSEETSLLYSLHEPDLPFHEKDTELYSLLDDMNYLLNETLMGAQAKGETVLPSIATKLTRLEQRELSNKNE
jgi:hypothetical protein